MNIPGDDRLASFGAVRTLVLHQFQMGPGGEVALRYISPGVADLFEISAEEACADPERVLGCLDAADRAALRAAALESFRTLGELSSEHRIATPSGASKWVRIQSVPERQADGSVLWSGMFGDITESKRLEAQLRTQEGRLATLLHASPVGVFESDGDKRFTFVNDAWTQLIGLPAGEIIGAAWTDLIHPEDRPAVEAETAASLRERRLFKAEYRYLLPDGSVRWVLGMARPLPRAPGAPLRYIGTVTDISARKAAEREAASAKAQIEAAYRAKSRLLATASHELRQPLAALSLLTDRLATSLPPGQVQLAANIARSVADLAALVDALFGAQVGAQVGEARNAAPVPASTPSARKKLIALVDDHAMVLEALSQSLEEAGYRVCAAASREELMGRLGGSAPDVVVSDYRLAQGETGYDVIMAVEAAFGAAIPALLVTGDASPALVRSMGERGVKVFSKPLKMAALLEAIATATRAVRAPHASEPPAPDVGQEFLLADFYAEFFHETTLGVAYHKMLYDAGEPADYVYLYTNPAFHRHAGLPDSVIGKRISELRPTMGGSDPQAFAAFHRVAAGGAPEHLEINASALDRWYAIWVYSPRPEHFFTIFEDISARKRQELELRHARELLSLAQQAAHAGVWNYDLETREMDWTPELCDLMGLDRATHRLTHEVWQSLLHPEDRATAAARAAQSIAERRQVSHEYRIVRPNGEEAWIASYGGTRRDASGKPKSLAGIAIDVSERKRGELRRANIEGDLRQALREIEAKERSRSRFLAATTHDLRQPLFAAQLQLDRLAAEPLAGRQLEKINSARQALAAMSGELQLLLERSTREEDQPAVNPRGLSARELFEGLAGIFSGSAEQAGVRLLFRAGGRRLHSDPNLLARLMGNLIANAIKFSPRGTVLVCARRIEGGLLLQVRDNGAGIADFDADQAFGEAYTLGQGERNEQGGYGLGLWIVGRLGRLLGCDISVATAPGRGSAFSLRFPD